MKDKRHSISAADITYSFLVLFLGFTALFMYICTYENANTALAVVTVLFLSCIFAFFRVIYTSLHIREDGIIIKKMVMFWKKDIDFIKNENLSYSYRKSLVGRGRMDYKLFIYNDEEEYLSLYSSMSGWTDAGIKALVEDLKSRNIPVQSGYKE